MHTDPTQLACSACGHPDADSERRRARPAGVASECPDGSSPDTTVSPETSRVEVEHVLRRHGAKGFSYVHDCTSGRITVSFIVPESPTATSHEVAVQLPIDVRRVYDRLYGQPPSLARDESALRGEGPVPRFRGNGYESRKLEHAERVAWRHLLQWLDSALAAAAAGFQTMSEAFFAHTVVAFDDGRRGRLVDYLESEQSHLAPGIRALLVPPIEDIAA
jgi:hypothetical protein